METYSTEAKNSLAQLIHHIEEYRQRKDAEIGVGLTEWVKGSALIEAIENVINEITELQPQIEKYLGGE